MAASPPFLPPSLARSRLHTQTSIRHTKRGYIVLERKRERGRGKEAEAAAASD